MSLGLNPYPAVDSSGVVIEPLAKTHPWRRFFARKIDNLCFALLVVVVLEAAGSPLEAGNSGLDLFYQIALILTWAPFEAVLLATSATTPGKLLFGIEVRTSTGARLSFMQALRRSAVVTVAGEGCGIGIISLIAQWRAWRRLENTGSTAWDEDEGHVVPHGEVALWRWAGVTLSVLLIVALLLLNGVLIIPFLGSLVTSVQ